MLSSERLLFIGGAGLLVAFVAGALVLAWRRWRHHRLMFAALLEQRRREANHDVKWRHDQRLNAIQQRLSRHLGKRRAFGDKMRRRVEAELHKSYGAPE